jgi:hypothetical protein
MASLAIELTAKSAQADSVDLNIVLILDLIIV